jgi:hypothetical protein
MDGDNVTADADNHGTTTWAARNPLKDVQSSRRRAKIHLTDAEKSARDLKCQLKRTHAVELQQDINAFNTERDNRILELARKHSKKPSYIRTLITSATHYKKKRAPSLRNALVHHKSLEVNEGTVIIPLQKTQQI